MKSMTYCSYHPDFDFNPIRRTPCLLCSDHFTSQITRGGFQCGAVAHVECFNTWLREDSECPRCKKPLMNRVVTSSSANRRDPHQLSNTLLRAINDGNPGDVRRLVKMGATLTEEVMHSSMVEAYKNTNIWALKALEEMGATLTQEDMDSILLFIVQEKPDEMLFLSKNMKVPCSDEGMNKATRVAMQKNDPHIQMHLNNMRAKLPTSEFLNNALLTSIKKRNFEQIAWLRDKGAKQLPENIHDLLLQEVQESCLSGRKNADLLMEMGGKLTREELSQALLTAKLNKREAQQRWLDDQLHATMPTQEELNRALLSAVEDGNYNHAILLYKFENATLTKEMLVHNLSLANSSSFRHSAEMKDLLQTMIREMKNEEMPTGIQELQSGDAGLADQFERKVCLDDPCNFSGNQFGSPEVTSQTLRAEPIPTDCLQPGNTNRGLHSSDSLDSVSQSKICENMPVSSRTRLQTRKRKAEWVNGSVSSRTRLQTRKRKAEWVNGSVSSRTHGKIPKHNEPPLMSTLSTFSNVKDATIKRSDLPVKNKLRDDIPSNPGIASPLARSMVGGKAMHLAMMQNVGIKTIPRFKCINTQMIKAFEEQPINLVVIRNVAPELMNLIGANALDQPILASGRSPLMPKNIANTEDPVLTSDYISHSTSEEYTSLTQAGVYDSRSEATALVVTLGSIKALINKLPPEEGAKRIHYLKILSDLIASDSFYQQVSELEVAKQIRCLYQQLQVSISTRNVACKPVIVRSSGVHEDNYGDAQAGKYESIVHGCEDIVRSCLKVMASTYQQKACPQGIPPQTMAIILQECISCQFGGVAFSYTSLDDDSIQVEYAPGQPKTAVSGLYGITPNSHSIKRKNGKITESSFTKGNIPHKAILEGNSYTHQYRETIVPAEDSAQALSDKTLDTVHHYAGKLENLLLCPVDIEFAIDMDNVVRPVQARPVTSLSGNMNFIMPEPENPEIEGKTISEGYACGTAFVVNSPLTAPHNLSRMENGFIVFADRCYDWMLTDDFLTRAGGFVLKNCGVSDHASIILRKANKPCIKAKAPGYWPPMGSDNLYTLVGGKFHGNPGAYLLKGDHTQQLQNAMDSSASLDYKVAVKAVEEYQPALIDFHWTDNGFQWLNKQNSRLLNYFDKERLLNLCLSPKNCLQLSMSRERVTILETLQKELKHLINDSECFATGLEKFLKIGTENGRKTISEDDLILKSLKDVEELKSRITNFNNDTEGRFAAIYGHLVSDKERMASKKMFREWIDDCQNLQASLQDFNFVDDVKEVQSIHDLIFYTHTTYINSLAAVAELSGQGKVTTTKDITYIDFDPLPEHAMLDETCRNALNNHPELLAKVIHVPNALMINISLGVHAAAIELFEQAEGSKGRTLRLKLSDDFSPDRDVQGKLKRFWFLVQLLRSASLDKSSAGLDIHLQESVGQITIECTRIESKKTMQEAFVKLLSVLPFLDDFDVRIDDVTLYEDRIPWSFDVLKKRLNEDFRSAENKLAFNICVFDIFYQIDPELIKPIDEKYMDEQYIIVSQYARKLSPNYCYSLVSSLYRKSPKEKLSSIEGDWRKDILRVFLLVDPKKAAPLVNLEYNWLRERESIIHLVKMNKALINMVPDKFKQDKEIEGIISK